MKQPHLVPPAAPDHFLYQGFARSMVHSIGASFSVVGEVPNIYVQFQKWLFKTERLETKTRPCYYPTGQPPVGSSLFICRNRIIIKLFL